METVDMVLTDNILTLFVIVLISGMIASKVSKKLKVPDVVLFLIVGIIIGPSVLNLVSTNEYHLGNQLILTFGSAFILYDGGREIKLDILNDVKYSVGLLATLGVVITAFAIGIVAVYVFHMDFIYALLLGAVIASTDPATLVPVFKEITLRDKVKQTVISESAFNDAVGAILVLSILTIIQSGVFSLTENIYELVIMILGGLIVGCIMGIVFSFIISDSKYGIFHEYAPLISILAVAIAYTFAEKVHGSGYMATFIIGLICGNKKTFKLWVPEIDFTIQRNVRETLAFLMRMAIFILLGIQVDFNTLSKYWGHALIIVVVMMFIVRPLVVIICTFFDKKAKWNWRERIFIMWVRETGVIPAALSGMIISMKIPHSDIISSVVFMTILITLLFQASTTKYLAKKLNLLE
ncbi:cation:proton antiporter [Clostridium aestuarii]|uniref:Cation:proton antiporter n=1 Tax=Clostridium aestuarii TaxID=338193 RepID=A0ABT4D660_9CLOT|nr:cation:proton antiporter [Clostridium aestuarii]MCY6485660.1 cation:proton antiporter [Clostridium aestuarii]